MIPQKRYDTTPAVSIHNLVFCLYPTLSAVSWAGGISCFPINIIFDWKNGLIPHGLKPSRHTDGSHTDELNFLSFLRSGTGFFPSMTVPWDCGSHKYKALRIQVWPKKGIGIIVGPRDVLTINPTLGIRLDSKSVTNENQTKNSTIPYKRYISYESTMDPHGVIH